MGQIGLRFMLRYSHYLDILLTMDHAKQIMDRFKQGNQAVFEGIDLRGIAYVVSASEVMGLHTVPVEMPKATPALQTNRSGIV
jgi:hypothetical protein